jgi:amino acid adenylation domain-containing protein
MTMVGSENHPGLSAAARALLRRRAHAAENAAGDTDGIARCPGESAPLSPWQRGIWLFDQLNRASTAYHVSHRLHLGGDLDIAAMERSLREVFRRHTILRSRVEVEQGEPVQRILPIDQVALPWFDLSGLAAPDRARRYREIADAMAGEPFDLASGPFARVAQVRLTSTEHVVLSTIHHIASDGWSVTLFFQELAALYNAFSADLPTLPEPPIQYRDYAAWQCARTLGSRAETDIDYWLEELAGAPPLLELPTDRPRPSRSNHAGATESLILPVELVDALRALARACDATLFMTMLAAFQVLLARLSGQDDVVTGIPVAGRGPETEAVIGCFINVLPLRSRVAHDTTFRTLLGALRSTALQSYAHQQLPFAQLVERLRPERSASYSPVTQVLFNYLYDIPAPSLDWRGLHVILEKSERISSIDQFGLDITKAGGGLRCSALYSTELFDGSTIARWLGHYRTLLEGIVADPDKAVSRLPLLTDVERTLMLSGADAKRVAIDCEQCVHQLIEAQARRAPDAVAAMLDEDALTYAQLDRRANALAHKLKKLGVAPDTLVGVCLERSFNFVIATLAVLKAGGGYVPLDPSLPKERLAYIATDSGTRVFIASEATAQWLPDSETPVLYLGHGRQSDEAPDPPDSGVAPDNLAYVIYTSGSTGRPKGVAIEHRSLCNHVLWLQSADALGAADAALLRASIGFDFSVMELFWPLAAGARLILARPGGEADMAYLASLIETQRITLLMCVPTLLAALLEQPDVEKRCAGLRGITSGGEAMSPALLRRCLSRLPAVTLHNLYGPTEITIGCTSWTCSGTEKHTVPIGYPIANAELYILDAQLEPIPIGVTGELYVGGVGVARGYVGQPELTRERFLANPFRPDSGQRIYRTGDLVRRRPDGALEFLGRNDDQVKIRGVRIELGEIEAVLATHADVRACAVSVHRNASDEAQLVGYVVPRGFVPPDPHALRAFLAERLPEAMLPPWFVVLDAIPLTVNGKVDRAGLPAPDVHITHAEILDAGDPLQDELIRIWEDVLKVSPIGITDNFFELGGHSLLAVAMLDRVARTFGVKPPLQALFREPTVRCLAAAVIEAGRAPDGAGDAPLWCIQAGEPERAPLFLFHGDLNGGGLYCRKLVQHLDRRQPVYILPPHAPGGPQTVEAMAEDVLPHIRGIWPGPYLLAGYCNGGLVAFEAAQRLRALGLRVDLLAVIDLGLAYRHLRLLYRTMHAAGRMFGVESATSDRLLLRLREPLLRFLKEQSSTRRWRAIRVPLAASRFVALAALRKSRRALRRFCRLSPNGRVLSTADEQRRALPDWDTRRERLAFVGRAMQLYIPRPYPGRITVILSQARDVGHRNDPFHGWRAVAADVDGWIVAGGHFSIVTEHIGELAKVLRARLPDPDRPKQIASESIRGSDLNR